MAVRSITVTRNPSGMPTVLATWTGLTFTSTDTGEPFSYPDYPDMTVTFEGTFGTGGSITLQGSNDGTNWYALTDAQGNAITKTAAGMEVIEEHPLYIRPSVTAGDGSTSLQCRIMARRATR